jgi:type 1 glutamine amidotransferase
MSKPFLAVLLAVGLAAPCAAESKKKLLLVGTGPDEHPAETHEYLAGLRVLANCLEPVDDIEVTTIQADGAWKEGPELMERADGVVLFLTEGAKWVQFDPKRYEALTKAARRGGGISVLHWGMGTREAEPVEDFVKLTGGCHGGPDRKHGVFESTAKVVDPKHPITAGIGEFKLKDEFYYRLKFVQPEGTVTPLLRVAIDGKAETVAWCWERPDKGRAFGFSGLHFHANWRLPEYRRLVTQGVLWTMRVKVPREKLKVEVNEEDLRLK